MVSDDDLEGRLPRDVCSFKSALIQHLDSLTVVATTLVLTLSLYLHLGVIFPILYPPAELAVKHPTKVNFDWKTCSDPANLQRALEQGDSCPCWDGLFKGSYGLHGRRAMVFNIQRETLSIFALTCFFVCLVFVALKKVFSMILSKHLRWSAFLIVLCNSHSLYYHWWVSFSYLNEAWFRYWWSQWVFGVSETVVMYVLLLRTDSRYEMQPPHAVAVISVTSFHMSQGILTQAVKNFISGCAQVQGVARV
jgi:hypothetical protein